MQTIPTSTPPANTGMPPEANANNAHEMAKTHIPPTSTCLRPTRSASVPAGHAATTLVALWSA